MLQIDWQRLSRVRGFHWVTPQRIKAILILLLGAGLASAANFFTVKKSIEEYTRPNYSGAWTLHMETTNSTKASFKGMVLSYSMHLTHIGDKIEGSGELRAENATQVSGKRHTAMTVVGGMEKGAIHLVLQHEGLKRKTKGSMCLKEGGSPNVLKGTFDWDAAKTTGTVTAVRDGNAAGTASKKP